MGMKGSGLDGGRYAQPRLAFSRVHGARNAGRKGKKKKGLQQAVDHKNRRQVTMIYSLGCSTVITEGDKTVDFHQRAKHDRN